MTAPEVWWSPSLAEDLSQGGLIERTGPDLWHQEHGTWQRLDELPADAVRLISEDAADADALVRQARLKGMTIDEGAVELGLESPRELMIAWVWGARAMLGDAPNYSETRVDFPSASMTVKAAGEIDRYVLTVQRAGKLTPHEARQAAEAERDQLRSELAEEKREHLRTIDDALRVKEAWTAREQEIAAAGSVPDTGQAREATGRRDTAVEAAVAAWRDVQPRPFVMPWEMTELAIALDELTAAHETVSALVSRETTDDGRSRDAEPSPDTGQAPPSGFWDESGSTSIDWALSVPDTGQVCTLCTSRGAPICCCERPSADTGQAREPGYERIAEAIGDALGAAALTLGVYRHGSGEGVDRPYLSLARILDKAGLIDWNAFDEPSGDTVQSPDVADLAYARSEVDKWLADNDPYCILPTRTEHIPALLARLDELEGTR